MDLVDRYLPEFYYYHSGLYAQLAAALRERCEKLSDLRNIPQFPVQEKSLIDIFVQPRLQYLESKHLEGQRRNRILIRKPDEIIGKHSRILIIGDPGSGKSVIMREAVLRFLTENTRDRTPNLPLLVKARDLTTENDASFEENLNRVVKEQYGVSGFEVDNLSDANIILLIDGFDEIVNSEQREKIKLWIEDYGSKHANASIVISSRMTRDTTDVGSFTGYQKWYILPFNFAQVRRFLANWFSSRKETSDKLLTTLEDHDLLSRLPSTPLVLALVAILFESDDRREIPSNLAELYRMFVDLMLGRWSLDRRVENLYDANIREYIATEIALSLQRTGKTSMSQEDYAAVIDECASNLGYHLDTARLLDDLIEQTALLVRNDRGDIEFRHLSFQEFLVGLSIFKSGASDEKGFLISKAVDPWWSQILYFYCGLRQNNPDVLKQLVEQLPTLEQLNRIMGVLNLGYLVQSSYLTPADVRKRTIEFAFREYYGAINSIKEFKVENISIPEGVVFLVFVKWLSLQYASKALTHLYHELLESFLNQQEPDPETSFLVLSLAATLAEVGDTDALLCARSAVAQQPKQLMTLAVVSDFAIHELATMGDSVLSSGVNSGILLRA